ncbi:MAG: polysaccharide deacetylase family protein [Lachnospiraceae bacterium]|nr:polysaccharide deacetylase family protein [Lachnospiraceae bacterium]
MRSKIVLLATIVGVVCLGACRVTENGEKENVGLTPKVTVTGEPTVGGTPSATPIPTDTPTPVPADETAPRLTLLGETTMKVIARSEFTEPGFLATDDVDGDLTGQVRVTGEVDINWCGSYTLQYEVSDAAGNVSTAERVVEVAQPETIYPEGKVIYMTFDDGPGQYTEALLDLLDKYQIKATFFVCGNGITSRMLPKIKAAGHSIGAHCKSHEYSVVYESDEAYLADLQAITDMIYEYTGEHTTLIRFPGGSSNQVSKSVCPGIMTRMTERVTQMGYQYFDWNVSAGDCNTKDTSEILENMKKDIKKYQYSIVLQHPEHRQYSLDAIEELIVWALDNDYTFLPLSPSSPRVTHRIAN